MTKPIDDGGPAYPHNEKHDDGAHWATHSGLTKREAFAMAAMQGIVSDPDCMNYKRAAIDAVAAADALISALKGE